MFIRKLLAFCFRYTHASEFNSIFLDIPRSRKKADPGRSLDRCLPTLERWRDITTDVRDGYVN